MEDIGLVCISCDSPAVMKCEGVDEYAQKMWGSDPEGVVCGVPLCETHASDNSHGDSAALSAVTPYQEEEETTLEERMALLASYREKFAEMSPVKVDETVSTV